ncbi:PTS sugar transporter subunit IIA [Halobacillus litoralis]|uniref:Mannitol-specific phosphotransferase enzyme IIA component n=1 Tax=Halobacillus faecis TaxID=360184 RepID=A0A511WNR2_9BACI|nr:MULTISPECIES: PTS sugar transporter subunit IIA [Halobacillus]MBX0357001.1 PTS sugar transporter subunit IIA [Halobacillus sp. Nhm2S1]WLR47448.1 PTS sugar transporter subunit IIA [Halobacillus litoralis]GEN52789.1 mannitol-specific phosphotransferase enzyme IIA component [Halobacillus faecis]
MSTNILKKENIELNKSLATKEEAIRYVGGILNEQGYVDEAYIEEMLKREEITSTFMGNFVAIPHGTEDAKKAVNETGISVVTVPEGVDFGDGNIVKLLIGIAGKGNEHLEILSQIAIVCSEEENVEKLIAAETKEEVLQTFSEVE